MASANNIFLVNIEPPFKRYVKTIPSKLSGIRFDSRGEKEIGFVLESNPSGEFDYDSEVLEIYTDKENRAFKQLNRSLFSQGFLKEYTSDAPEVITTNMLSDEEVVDVASMRNIKQLEAKLAEFTSPYTLQRILTAATDIGRPAKTVAVIEDRLNAVR